MLSSCCGHCSAAIAWIGAHRFVCAYALLLIFSLWPTRFADHYDAIPVERMFDELAQATTANVVSIDDATVSTRSTRRSNTASIPAQSLAAADASSSQLPVCDYRAIIAANRFLYRSPYRDAVTDTAELRLGGEFRPADCRPLFSTAIIVPYRARERQLDAFLQYMHNFLRRQRLHYRVYLVEQADWRPFNRAKLFNIGFEYARRDGFPCVVLHDVDLMPMRLGQLYACTHRARHMSASLDEFRFNLPYRGLFGGAVALRTEQYAEVNGMSNVFEGWGGEDDDLYARLQARQMEVCRFEAAHSQYAMLQHAKEPKNADRMVLLRTARQRMATDGLNSLRYEEREYRKHALFTHVLAVT